MSKTLNTSTNRSTNGSTVERVPFEGNGQMVMNDDGRGFSVIFPQGKSQPFAKKTLDALNAIGFTGEWG